MFHICNFYIKRATSYHICEQQRSNNRPPHQRISGFAQALRHGPGALAALRHMPKV
jgi:hypothetical protein